MKKIFLTVIRIKNSIFRRIRVFYYRCLLNDCGKGVVIDSDVELIYPEKITFGNRIIINRYSMIQGTPKSSIVIGDDVVISYGVKILTASLFVDFLPFKHYYKDDCIGNRVWLAANVTVLPGVIINDDVIVAANSLVTKDLESGYVYGGVPAQKIKKVER